MVHIRCSYNNRFLQRLSETKRWIAALALEPEDNQTLWQSTLFQPEFAPNDPTGMVRLLHVQLGRYAHWQDNANKYVTAEEWDPADPKTSFQVIDRGTLVTLPKHLAFRGDNRLLLGLRPGVQVLQFAFGDEKDETVANQIVPQPDGTFRIKSVSRKAFWRANTPSGYQHTYIWADDVTTADNHTLHSSFAAVKVNDRTVALRNLGNNLFTRRYSYQVTDGLTTIDSQITAVNHLELVELVASRRIKNIKFHLGESWVHDETPNVVLNEGEEVRNETDETQDIEVEISYLDKTSSTWTSTSSSFKVGPAIRVQPPQIPCVTDSSVVQMTSPFAPSYVWGETTAENPDQVKVHEVTLPPWTMVTVKLLATKATCDVPLTYTRYDKVKGREEVHIMEDGLYTGTNYFDFTFEESLPQPIPKEDDE
ncbi:unnamed protein product [Linum tenue]|uniref:Agglutinin domain-containing protein n=1 Tax=Linum tenue TaxID=586396 RepID=A0AAV0II95_9ROSI|nr:unnamed protein product [Linum tenue]